MQPSKLAVPIVLVTAAIAAAAMFSIHPRASQTIAGAPDKELSAHVSTARPAANPSSEAALRDSSWVIWLPLTGDGQ